jgi:hypothetical protein
MLFGHYYLMERLMDRTPPLSTKIGSHVFATEAVGRQRQKSTNQ